MTSQCRCTRSLCQSHIARHDDHVPVKPLIGSGTGVMACCLMTPCPEPMSINRQRGIATFTRGQFHRKCSRYSPLLWVSKLLNYNYYHITQGQWIDDFRGMWRCVWEVWSVALTQDYNWFLIVLTPCWVTSWAEYKSFPTFSHTTIVTQQTLTRFLSREIIWRNFQLTITHVQVCAS